MDQIIWILGISECLVLITKVFKVVQCQILVRHRNLLTKSIKLFEEITLGGGSI